MAATLKGSGLVVVDAPFDTSAASSDFIQATQAEKAISKGIKELLLTPSKTEHLGPEELASSAAGVAWTKKMRKEKIRQHEQSKEGSQDKQRWKWYQPIAMCGR